MLINWPAVLLLILCFEMGDAITRSIKKLAKGNYAGSAAALSYAVIIFYIAYRYCLSL